ncbi:MAG: site-2 protease family protein, partial [Spirochaetales bacterium]|nr:site-2 protease family protein [Spirochaetales bacterium]
IGIGPVIWRHWGKKTEFRLSLIPFGGYCRLGGSEDLTVALSNKSKKINTAEKGSFFAISPWRKFLIFLSGPMTNFLLAFLLLAIVSAIPVKRISHGLIVAPISDYSSLYGIDTKQETIKKGDIIISSGDKKFIDWEDFSSWLSNHKGEDIELNILRNKKETTVTISPTLLDSGYSYGIANLEKPVIGRSEDERIEVGDRLVEANGHRIEWTYDLYLLDADSFNLVFEGENGRKEVKMDGTSFPFAWKTDYRISPDSSTPFSTAFNKTIDLSKRTAAAIIKLLSFNFKEALEIISGPFTSAKNIGRISTLAFSESSRSGIRTLLYLLSIISISISIGNLIPIPTFDGGQMIITIAEMIVHRPLKPNTYLVLHISGMVMAWALIIAMNAWGIVETLFL